MDRQRSARARARVYVRVVLPRTMYQCTKHRVRVNAARGVACARARCIFFFHPSTNERTNVTSGRVINQNPMQRRQRPPIKRRSLLKRLVTNPRSCNAARSLSLTHTDPAPCSPLDPLPLPPPAPRTRIHIYTRRSGFCGIHVDRPGATRGRPRQPVTVPFKT